jgi:hypothetical protein
MRSGAFVLLVILNAGCSQATTIAPANQTSPTSVAAAPERSTIPSPTSPPTPIVDFSCRLPVVSVQKDATGSYPAGFISFPDGTFRRDLTAPPNPGYFDRAASAWLPVGRQAVSPDGLHYVTTTEGVADRQGVIQTPVNLHIVAVSTNSDRVIPLTDLQPQPGTTALFLLVLDFESDSVYGIEYGQAGAGELYRFDLPTGKLTDLYRAGRPEMVESGGFWFGDYLETNPPAHMGYQPDSLQRWDLSTHATTTWFYRPSAYVYILGLDRSGAAVVLLTNISSEYQVVSTEIWRVSKPGTETRIYSAPNGDQVLDRSTSMIADEHGLWFGGPKGIFLYTADAGTRKVSDYVGAPANGCY